MTIATSNQAQVINGQKHEWVREWGYCPVKLATEFCVGDTIVFTAGITGKIEAIEEKSKCYLVFTVRSSETGKTMQQNIKKASYKPYC